MRITHWIGTVALAFFVASGTAACGQQGSGDDEAKREAARTEGGTQSGSTSDVYTGALGRKESGSDDQTERTSELTARSREFLETAAQDSALEVQAGQLASRRARSLQVREFAMMMVQTHQRVNDSVTVLAQSKGAVLQTTLSAEGQQLLERLASLTGEQFDREYSREMLAAHQRAVRLFEDAAQSVRDEDVKSFARTQLPTLRDHLRMAHVLSASVRG